MIKRNLLISLLLFLASPCFASSATLAEWAFTDQIINSRPANEIDMTTMSKKDIYIFTRWQDLEIDFYEVEVQIYDGENTLVGYSNYGFKPDKTTWDSWTRYHFRTGTDKPGEWRFVVKLNKSKVLEERIYVEE